MSAPLTSDLAQIGKSVVIKGELSGSEDLYVDGQVEGSISLKNNSLTVGPNGSVKATVEAKGIVVQGKLEGNVQASDRVELRKSAVVTGSPLRKAPTSRARLTFRGNPRRRQESNSPFAGSQVRVNGISHPEFHEAFSRLIGRGGRGDTTSRSEAHAPFQRPG